MANLTHCPHYNISLVSKRKSKQIRAVNEFVFTHAGDLSSLQIISLRPMMVRSIYLLTLKTKKIKSKTLFLLQLASGKVLVYDYFGFQKLNEQRLRQNISHNLTLKPMTYFLSDIEYVNSDINSLDLCLISLTLTNSQKNSLLTSLNCDYWNFSCQSSIKAMLRVQWLLANIIDKTFLSWDMVKSLLQSLAIIQGSDVLSLSQVLDSFGVVYQKNEKLNLLLQQDIDSIIRKYININSLNHFGLENISYLCELLTKSYDFDRYKAVAFVDSQLKLRSEFLTPYNDLLDELSWLNEQVSHGDKNINGVSTHL